MLPAVRFDYYKTGLNRKCPQSERYADRMIQIFGVDKSAEFTVNWSTLFGLVSS